MALMGEAETAVGGAAAARSVAAAGTIVDVAAYVSDSVASTAIFAGGGGSYAIVVVQRQGVICYMFGREGDVGDMTKKRMAPAPPTHDSRSISKR